MNRRDMIIVATLMNTGLLAVLFMMAAHTESDNQPIIPTPQAIATTTHEVAPPKPTPQQEEQTIAMAKTSRHDELDGVISKYSTSVPPRPVLIDEDLFQEQKNIPEKKAEPAAEQVLVEDNKPEYIEIKVKRGDSLDKIARANSTTIKALKRANNLSSDRLQIGQILRIPPATAEITKSVGKKNTPASETVASAEYYTIKSGDNPWKIAKQFGVRFDQLLQLNNLDEGKARRLKAGDKIRVR